MKAFLREASFSCVRGLVGIGVLSALFAAPAAMAENEDIRDLKQRVRLLEREVAALQRQHLPVEASVDCGAGASINETLAANAQGEGLLTIYVSGTCVENVKISRSNVVLQGAGGASIQAVAGAVFIVEVNNNVGNVTLRDLTVSGSSTAAVLAHKGAHLTVKNTVLAQSGAGVMALDNGVVDVAGSTLRVNSNGAYASRGGVISISNSTLESNSIGVLAWKAGTVLLTSGPSDDPTSGVGPIVQNNTTGVVVRSGGFVELADATIQNNAQTGILVDSGGAAHFFSSLNGSGTRVSGHANIGVVAFRNSSLVFSDNTNAITGNGRGIVCTGNPSYIVPQGFSVTGNTVADITGCLP